MRWTRNWPGWAAGRCESLLEAGHPDRFALLGAHAVAVEWCCALLPGAQAVAVCSASTAVRSSSSAPGFPLFIGALPGTLAAALRPPARAGTAAARLASTTPAASAR